MKKIVFILAIFLVIPIVLCYAQQPTVLKVDGGLLQGIFEDGLTVGDLRWHALQPVQKWDVEYDKPKSLLLLPYNQEIQTVGKVKIASI